jgi:pimeloyl-ACP methyl ester carboxylesterase
VPALERWLLPLLVAAAAAGQNGGGTLRAGAQVATFHSSVDDSNQPYAVYVPHSLEPGRRYPLVVSLHSEESNHRLNLRQIFGVPARFGESDTEDMRFFPAVRDPGYIVASPLARGSMGYQGIAERDVYDMLADLKSRLPVDDDRIYLTGISMGGGGALWLALTRPDVWAAVAPLCPLVMPGTEEYAANALGLPVRIFQGDQDPVTPVAGSRAWQRRLLDLGTPVDYIEYPGMRHNVWDFAYKDGAIFEWFGRSRRNRAPDRVRFASSSYRYDSAYWVHLDAITPGTVATLDAKRTGAAAVQVKTADLEGFTLNLDRPASLVTIDGTAVKIKPAAALSFVKTAAGWKAGRAALSGKRPGLEGPIVEAVSGRQIYVYGTIGAETAEELAARRRIAEAAAHWSSYRARLNFTPVVKADTAVTPEDLDSSNVILFGTAATNALIRRFAPQLPLALSPAAADYGLLFIAPAGKHYALISSGLPWWTGADDVTRGGYSLAPPPYRLLSTFGDYILFKGSLGNVVAEGRLDRNWKVPPDASAKMLATGTVSIR